MPEKIVQAETLRVAKSRRKPAEIAEIARNLAKVAEEYAALVEQG